MLVIETHSSSRTTAPAAQVSAPKESSTSYFDERQAAAKRFTDKFESSALSGSLTSMTAALQGLVENTDFSDAARLGRAASQIVGKMLGAGNVPDLPLKLHSIVDRLWEFSPEALSQIQPETGLNIFKALFNETNARDEQSASPLVSSMQRLAVTINNCADYQREYERPRFNAFMTKVEMDHDIETLLRKPFSGNELDLRDFSNRFIDLYRQTYQLPRVALRFGPLDAGTIGQANGGDFGITVDTSQGKITDWATLGQVLTHELRHLNQKALQASALKAAGHSVPAWADSLAIDPKFHAQGLLNAYCGVCYTLKDDGLESGVRAYTYSLLERDANAGKHYVGRALGADG